MGTITEEIKKSALEGDFLSQMKWTYDEVLEWWCEFLKSDDEVVINMELLDAIGCFTKFRRTPADLRLRRFEFYELLRNDENNQFRVTYRVDGESDVFAVVKNFDPNQEEMSTVKLFFGSYEKVRSHWKTQSLSTFGEKEALIWANEQLLKFINLMGLDLIVDAFLRSAGEFIETYFTQETPPVGYEEWVNKQLSRNRDVMPEAEFFALARSVFFEKAEGFELTEGVMVNEFYILNDGF